MPAGAWSMHIYNKSIPAKNQIKAIPGSKPPFIRARLNCGFCPFFKTKFPPSKRKGRELKAFDFLKVRFECQFIGIRNALLSVSI